jgi:hypothetical protein
MDTAENNSSMALSQAYDPTKFLRDLEAAVEIKSPLEENQSLTSRFANNTTGTVKMEITPDLLAQLADIRNFPLSTEFRKLGQFVQELQRKIPQNNGYYSCLVNPSVIATRIPDWDTVADISEETFKKAQFPLETYSGVVTIYGIPIWERLQGERIDFYNIFKIYRDMRYGLLDSGEYMLLNRTIAGLAQMLNVTGNYLSFLAKVYNWTIRCAYYDKYMELEIVKRRTQEIQLLQNDHLKVAHKLVEDASAYLKANMKMLKPSEAISMLELGMKYSRISLGLCGDKPGTPASAGNAPTLAIFNNTTNNSAEQMLNVNAAGASTPVYGSDVERQLQENMTNEQNVLSVLHVLQASGALNIAIKADIMKNPDMKEIVGDSDG